MTLPHDNRALIGAISFETLALDPTLVLPTNLETTQKLIHVLVTELHRLRGDIDELRGEIQELWSMPKEPTEVTGKVMIQGTTYDTGLLDVPGIGTGVAYAAADAFGTTIRFSVPPSGIIQAARFLDKDDEGIETDLVIFDSEFDETADNAAFTVSDTNFQKYIATITFATFKNFTVNQVSTASALGLPYKAPTGFLYCQMVTRGAPNIAAANIPQVGLTILPDN